jgi:hypothetical protein
MASLRVIISIVFFLSLLFVPSTRAADSISITAQPAFTQVRPCVQNCLFCGEYWLINCPNHADGLNNILSAGIHSIYCREDLRSTASSYLTSCIASISGCSNTIDVGDGISLYNGYCKIDGAELEILPSVDASTTKEDPVTTTPTRKPSIETITAPTSTPPPDTVTLDASPGSTPTVVVYTTVIDGSSRRVTITSEWLLCLIALSIVTSIC